LETSWKAGLATRVFNYSFQLVRLVVAAYSWPDRGLRAGGLSTWQWPPSIRD